MIKNKDIVQIAIREYFLGREREKLVIRRKMELLNTKIKRSFKDQCNNNIIESNRFPIIRCKKNKQL